MLTFFRRIRKRLLGEGALPKYLIYAIGEIALVVIGILIALQINNWNEARKENKTVKRHYRSLLSTLRQDSSAIHTTFEFHKNSLNAQEIFLSKNYDSLVDSLDAQQILKLYFQIIQGGLSYFPRIGTYNMLVANDFISKIASDDIQSKLANLYDYHCKGYSEMDRVIQDLVFKEFLKFSMEKLSVRIPNSQLSLDTSSPQLPVTL